jgi:hypothetical protein
MARWFGGLLLGAVVGGIAFLIALWFIGPGNGYDVPAVLLFPFTRLVSAYFDVGAPVVMGVGLLQYPIYGAVIGHLWPSRRGPVCIIAIHVAASALALYILGIGMP